MEQAVLDALRDPAFSVQEVRAIAAGPGEAGHFVLLDDWLALVGDSDLDSWRRLAAAQLLLANALDFPMTEDAFNRTVLEPLSPAGVETVDMSVAQFVPIERNTNELVRMMPLPVETGSGAAGLYYALDPETREILRAGVYPASGLFDAGAHGEGK